MSKAKANTGWMVKRWQIIMSVGGMIIYTIGILIAFFVAKTNMERDIQSKVDEKTARFLNDQAIGELKTNVISDLQERVKYLERKK